MPGSPRTRQQPSLRFRRLRALTLLIVTITIASLTVHLVRTSAAEVSTAHLSARLANSLGTRAPSATAAAAAMNDKVGNPAEAARGRMSVLVADLSTGVTAAYGSADRKFTTASIVKVDILATLLLQRNGKLTASQRALAERMIRASDNRAATALWRQIGRTGGLKTANQQFGLTSTVGGTGGRWGTTTTTANDQLRLLRVVFAADSPLPAESRRYLQSLMGTVVADQDWGVSAADTRKGRQYFVKNGWLPRSRHGWIVNSIGSVEHQGHRLLIVALSDGRPSKDSGVEVLELASKSSAEAVTGS